ncbi:FAD-dependent oxidoreductase [Chlorobium sp. N1]|uniref:FAD-dependent oxidoreductase n=1 Tax=Chlorobium sp. N1 TaxID=2491138 RepID=UPI00103DFA2D|nr:FAD-dependent oxidoreductase [Chlorobium sp. N1]TCD47607.1 FAD-dependent oxidoreductase [Chlorobium sp. N1]
MNRRNFIRKVFSRTGIAVGAAAAASAGLVGYFQPRREFYAGKEDFGEGRESAAEPKRCVVVGGGLAGMSAAMELALKGMAVTLVESSTSLGGKLTGWEIEALGTRFPVEHGFHGFFDQYYNLNALFREAGVGPEAFDASPGYPVLFSERQREIYGQTPKLFPFNILSVVGQSRSLDIASFLREYRGLPPVMGMFAYDYDGTFGRYDDIDFMEYCRRGEILPAFIDTVLHPFADATMNRMEVLSAAEAIRYFHFYFMGSPEGLSFRITNRDCMTAVVNPIERRLRELGVRVLSGRRALRLEHQGGRISGVRVGTDAGGPEVLHVDRSAVPASGWVALMSREGVPVLVCRDGNGYRALDGRCTHMGCPVSVAEDGFFCPCHAGRFNSEGVPVGGPPPTPLGRLSVSGEGETLALRLPQAESTELLACDYCVLASDVRGTREIVRRSELRSPAFEASVGSLGEADPYAVYRVWLDRPVDGGGFPFYTVSGYTYTDSVSIYSAFQEPFITWAGEHGGSVVELHAYAIAPEDMRSDDEIRLAMLDELHRLLPDTAGAAVLHEVFMLQSNFTRWAPGDHDKRPGPETPFPNLFLAGDWVRVDAPVFLMEAAAFTGRMAANAVCRNEGVRQTPLPIVPMEGIFA